MSEISIIDKMVAKINDPVMIFSLLVMGGMLLIIFWLFRSLNKSISGVSIISGEVGECGATLGKLVTLVEVLVFQKTGKRT
jgi:hypothetical protein